MQDFSLIQYLNGRWSSEALPERRQRARRIFLNSLLFSTWIPMAFFLSLGRFGETSFSFPTMKTILLFVSAAHVPATIFFYTDGDFFRVLRANKVRYVYVPIALMICSGLIFAFSRPIVQAYLFLLFWAWQAYHYGRQNLGIYSFVSIAQKAKPPRRSERYSLEVATICGILGTFKILGTGVAPGYLQGTFSYLYLAGYWAFIGLLVFSVVVYLGTIKDSSLAKTLFFFTLILFFFPIYLSNNINITFLSYAIAHGVQYMVFMTVVSLNGRQDDLAKTISNVLKLLAITLLVGFIFYRMADLKELGFIKQHVALARSLDFMIGAIVGATMAHFVVDAGIWRLSKAYPRAYMAGRFGFIFNA